MDTYPIYAESAVDSLKLNDCGSYIPLWLSTIFQLLLTFTQVNKAQPTDIKHVGTVIL